MKDNAARNGFSQSRYSIHKESIQEYQPEQKYDALFANPPFVPVPDRVIFPIHSDGGIDGNVLTNILLRRLKTFLKPDVEQINSQNT